MARKPPKPAMSVTNVKNIFDANAGSNPSFFSIKGIDEPNKFPINILVKTAEPRAKEKSLKPTKLNIRNEKVPTKMPFMIPISVCFPITSRTLASETSFLAKALITIAKD